METYRNLVLQGRVLLDQVSQELSTKDLLLETRRSGDTLATTDEADDLFDVGAELEQLSQEDLSEESSDSSDEDSLTSVELDDLRGSPRSSNVHFESEFRTFFVQRFVQPEAIKVHVGTSGSNVR